MSHYSGKQVVVRRQTKGWSQQELAERAGISRAAVSAIETGRIVPSVDAALDLALALGCTVETLFVSPAGNSAQQPPWAWEPLTLPCRFWVAELYGQVRRIPIEDPRSLSMTHDGISTIDSIQMRTDEEPTWTLVLAGCDPAAGLLIGEISRHSRTRIVAIERSSAAALEMLKQKKVHLAGLHLNDGAPEGNIRVVRNQLGPDYRLLHLAKWSEGIALGRDQSYRSVQQVMRSTARWIMRNEGSGAQRCLEQLFAEAGRPHSTTSRVSAVNNHISIVEAIKCGIADAGICVQMVAVASGLNFLPVHQEFYDLAYHVDLEADHRFESLKQAIQTKQYRTLLSDLSGCDTSCTGEFLHVS